MQILDGQEGVCRKQLLWEGLETMESAQGMEEHLWDTMLLLILLTQHPRNTHGFPECSESNAVPTSQQLYQILLRAVKTHTFWG